MSASRLNILSVGSNPNLLYYTWKLQNSEKFNVHIVIDDADPGSPIEIQDVLTNSRTQFKPEILVNKIAELNTRINYDIILVSCKSLQDISTLAAVLVPYLSKNTIVLIESTGFVNLEPFLKNCLPKTLQITIFSLISTVEIRKIGRNDYINLKVQREIFIGESSTSTAKYSSATQQNLGALTKLFQYKNSDSLAVHTKSSFLEFLIEEWKCAISRICFDPLLILFEVSKPSELQLQILAKPLLSGLVTEMITVAKIMGCKLPSGYDSESNLLKTWSDEYSKRQVFDKKALYLESPPLFYKFFHRMDLDIDLLLLQPILLADDHGIKTPYLEFLYATICQYEKLNSIESHSIFFKRVGDDDETQVLKDEIFAKDQLILAEKQKSERLALENRELLKSNERLSSREVELNAVLTNFENLKLKQQQLQSSLHNKTKDLQQAEAKIQQLQRAPPLQSIQLQQQPPSQNPPQFLSQHSRKGSMTASTSQISHIQAPPQQPRIRGQGDSGQQNEYSVNGTPDLSDLAAAALYGSQLETLQLNSATEQPVQKSLDGGNGGDFLDADDTEQSHISTSTSKDPAPSLKLHIPYHGASNPPQALNEISAKEQELQRREQLLLNREMELSKRFNQLNRGPLQNSQFPPPQFQNQTLQNRYNNVSNGQSYQQPPLQQLQPPIQPRRSTMPVLDSNQLYNGSVVSGGGPLINNGFNQPVKKTSRKNRKSSFPLGTSNLSDNYNDLIPSGGADAANNLRTKRSTQLLQQSHPQNTSPLIQQGPPMHNAAPQKPDTESSQLQQTQGLAVPPQPQFHSNGNGSSKNSSFSSIPENAGSNGSSSSGVLNPVHPESQNNSSSSANLNEVSGVDQSFLSDSDARPLGGVIADIDPNAREKKKKKSRFGFGRKK